MNKLFKRILLKIFANLKKNPYIWGFFTIVLLFATPAAILFSYYLGSDGIVLIRTDLTIDGAFSFYGSFLAFLGTVALGALALHQNIKANEINKNVLNLTEESERRAVLPYISINRYISKYSGNMLSSLISKVVDNETPKNEIESIPLENDLKREDILLNEIVFTIDKDRNITIKDSLDKKQRESIQSTFSVNKNATGGEIIAPNICYIIFNLKNVGRGSAIELQCIFSEKSKEKNCSIPISLTP